jgi:hypothetical protein
MIGDTYFFFYTTELGGGKFPLLKFPIRQPFVGLLS